jgi:hypothetical protein
MTEQPWLCPVCHNPGGPVQSIADEHCGKPEPVPPANLWGA